jgi:hypothetical protein
MHEACALGALHLPAYVGRHNPLITAELFPHRPEAWRTAW